MTMNSSIHQFPLHPVQYFFVTVKADFCWSVNQQRAHWLTASPHSVGFILKVSPLRDKVLLKNL